MSSVKNVPTADDIEDAISQRYPRDITFGNEKRLTLTRMVPSDWEYLEKFLRDVPDEDRRFFRREASAVQRVERWCQQLDYRHILPVLAWDGERIVADGILERESGLWTSHVGKLRILVHPDYRRQGLGAALLHELTSVANDLELHKVMYECAAEQTKLISFLVASGFVQAARLLEFIRDRHGQLHEMVHGAEVNMTGNTITSSRSAAYAAEKQMRSWALRLEIENRIDYEDPVVQLPDRIHPYVAISREVGAGAGEIARRVGQRLGWEVLGRELLDCMSQQHHLSRTMLETVDETTTSWLLEVFGKWLSQKIVTQSEYVVRLGQVVLMAAHDGRKVFIGRGAQFFLPAGRGVLIQLVCERDRRIRRVMQQRNLERSEAEQLIDETDRARSDFVRRYFHHDVTDPHLYDLVLRTDHDDWDNIVEVIVGQCQRRFEAARDRT